jgi:hypothetical protein
LRDDDEVRWGRLLLRAPDETVTYTLDRANDALGALRSGALQGAAVLVP